MQPDVAERQNGVTPEVGSANARPTTQRTIPGYNPNLGLAGKWKHLRGEAGLHTAMQPHAFGVVFVIKTDGREVYRSLAMRGPTKPSYDLDLMGVKTLELIVEKAAERNGGNWGLWLDPVLSR